MSDKKKTRDQRWIDRLEKNRENLPKAFPNLYRFTQSVGVGDGWLPIIWWLSAQLEDIILRMKEENPDAKCSNCGCPKSKHYASKTNKPGKCLAILVDPYSEEEPPGNYYACHCEEYLGMYPYATQVKEKFGGLRFYMSYGNDEIFRLIDEASEESHKTCEVCGEPGEARDSGWVQTLCDTCDDKGS